MELYFFILYKIMLFNKTREDFLKFFEERGHKIVSSSSLIPDDPSVLLTTAGMQQFKKYYTGELNPQSDFGSNRTTTLQKCFRTSDIEEVGDETHLTFFEMMGNFSFGPVGSDDPKDFGSSGYFKRSAIVWAYEFITNTLEISPERIYVTVFEGDNQTSADKESYAIWRNKIGLSEDKIRSGKREDNFWGPTGVEGPCGPTTEIYVDGVEVWNLVFNEYYKNRDGSYTRVENPGIDTGMGFERLLVMLEGVKNVFETSAFSSIVSEIRKSAINCSEREIRILTDHIRSSAFLIADGIRPSNKEAGYVLRRLLRRIIVIKIKNDIHSDIFQIGFDQVEKFFGGHYSELNNKKEILFVWNEEFEKFQESIAKGMKEIIRYSNITGKEAFYIYESFGLPYELILELATPESIKNLNREDFENEYKKHQEISRAGIANKFGGHGLVLDTGELKAGNDEELSRVIKMHTATHLLQWSLRKNIDSNIKQMGSDINPQRLRFDFNFDRKLTLEEIKLVEFDVNRIIQEDLPVYFKEMPKEEASLVGALSFFRQKYPEVVRVYFIGSETSGGVVSAEFCGGPHIDHTLEIGSFKIIKEESVAKGIRRIRATIG